MSSISHAVGLRKVNRLHSFNLEEAPHRPIPSVRVTPSNACEEGSCEESVQKSLICHAERGRPAHSRETSRRSPAGEWLPQTAHTEIPG